MYNIKIFGYLQIYHQKALYNKENVAYLKLSFVGGMDLPVHRLHNVKTILI